MPKKIVRAAATPVWLLWRITGKPIHQRLFGRYFQAMISRLNSTLGELSDVRAELEEVRSELLASRAQQQELDLKMRSIVGGHWDATAVARRLAAIEDRIASDQHPTGQPSLEAEDLDLDLESRAPVGAEQPSRP